MKKLGFGTMRLPLTDPQDSAAIDIAQSKEMTDAFLENGFTYFDTAWMYHNFQSENAVREILTSRYEHERYTIATKLHVGFVKEEADRDRIFNEQLKKCGVGYFDYYLLHDLSYAHYKKCEEFSCFSWIAEKKAQGLVRHIGFSFHDTADVLEEILTAHPEMEFVQLQINYLDWESEAIQSRKCYETARKHGKDIVVMEPVKGGTLADPPAGVKTLLSAAHPDWSPASWAIRFAASLPGVITVLSGMSNREQMADNIGFMKDFTPLTDDERKLLSTAADMINQHIAIPCTGCSYCTDGCPQKIAIPSCFSLYNADLQEVDGKGYLSQTGYYEALTKRFGKASDCIGCGACEDICPQHLPIREYLAAVAEHFGK